MKKELNKKNRPQCSKSEIVNNDSVIVKDLGGIIVNCQLNLRKDGVNERAIRGWEKSCTGVVEV